MPEAVIDVKIAKKVVFLAGRVYIIGEWYITHVYVVLLTHGEAGMSGLPAPSVCGGVFFASRLCFSPAEAVPTLR